jgi:hypothetical protein
MRVFIVVSYGLDGGRASGVDGQVSAPANIAAPIHAGRLWVRLYVKTIAPTVATMVGIH